MCSAIKNWSYPVEGEIKNPFLELTKLAKATGGFYPMGGNGLWHGGIHMDNATHPTLNAGVRCIADGEVIAYRLDAQYPVSAYQSESRCTPAPFSTSFVLVKHRLMPPASEANTGTPPALVFYSLYMHLQDWAGYQSNPSLPRPTFWSDTTHRVDTQGSNLNLRAQARTDSAILASLPNGTRVKVAPEKGDFCKLLEIFDDSASPRLNPDANGQLPGYLAARFLRADERVPTTDQVIVLEQPVAITAGALVGYPGVYQNHDSAGKPLLHLEVFSCEDVPVYLQQSRSWADAHLPDRQKTLLKVYAGASKLIAHHPGISASTPPQLSDPGTVVGVDLIIPQSYLDTLPAERKISVKTPQGVTRWWHLDNLLADAQGQPISGWLAEQELITTRHSPWEWEGFECIEDSEPPKEGLAYYLNALHRLIDSELASYQGLVDQSDKGPIKSRLYDIIDANRDGKITPAEIRAALAKPWHAQSIAQLITRHESEWFWNPEKWNALDDLMGHSPSDPNPAWVTEKERIQKLCWWSDLVGKHSIHADGMAWHFHPIIIKEFILTRPSTESVAQKKFNENDAKSALLIIYKKYGKELATIIERMFRDETAHFRSKQYENCGTGGMEAFGPPPYYGWDRKFFLGSPEHTPIGIWEAIENRGLSNEGGNQQITDRKKSFIIFPSVLGAMEFKVYYINKYDGNWARWHSTTPSAQAAYRKALERIRPRFIHEFESEK